MPFGLHDVKQDDLPFSIGSSIMQNLLAIIFHRLFLKVAHHFNTMLYRGIFSCLKARFVTLIIQIWWCLITHYAFLFNSIFEAESFEALSSFQVSLDFILINYFKYLQNYWHYRLNCSFCLVLIRKMLASKHPWKKLPDFGVNFQEITEPQYPIFNFLRLCIRTPISYCSPKLPTNRFLSSIHMVDHQKKGLKKMTETSATV